MNENKTILDVATTPNARLILVPSFLRCSFQHSSSLALNINYLWHCFNGTKSGIPTRSVMTVLVKVRSFQGQRQLDWTSLAAKVHMSSHKRLALHRYFENYNNTLRGCCGTGIFLPGAVVAPCQLYHVDMASLGSRCTGIPLSETRTSQAFHVGHICSTIVVSVEPVSSSPLNNVQVPSRNSGTPYPRVFPVIFAGVHPLENVDVPCYSCDGGGHRGSVASAGHQPL